MSGDIREAAEKFDEVQHQLEEILRPYIEDVIEGKATVPQWMELKKVEEDDEETLFTLFDKGRPVAYIFKGIGYTTLILAGITSLTLWGALVPAYEEWKDNWMEGRDEEGNAQSL